MSRRGARRRRRRRPPRRSPPRRRPRARGGHARGRDGRARPRARRPRPARWGGGGANDRTRRREDVVGFRGARQRQIRVAAGRTTRTFSGARARVSISAQSRTVLRRRDDTWYASRRRIREGLRGRPSPPRPPSRARADRRSRARLRPRVPDVVAVRAGAPRSGARVPRRGGAFVAIARAGVVVALGSLDRAPSPARPRSRPLTRSRARSRAPPTASRAPATASLLATTQRPPPPPPPPPRRPRPRLCAAPRASGSATRRSPAV